MVKRAEDLFKEVKEQMRGGKGSVEITHFIQNGEIDGRCRLCAKLTINPGSSIGFHNHEGEDEIFYILKGEATVCDHDRQDTLKEGDVLVTGGGKGHSVENNGQVTLEILAVIALYN